MECTWCTREFPLDDLVEMADVLTLHVPLNDETHHLVGAPELRLMKPTAYLVNTSRGPVIDEVRSPTLSPRAALRAALDVFEREPDVEQRLLAPTTSCSRPTLHRRPTRRGKRCACLRETLRDVLLP